ncbi:MAG: aspartate--tRNA ligase, partial [Rhizomicrobium sp.]
MHAYRTHTCGQLRPSDVGTTVRLSGWVHRRRDHGGLVFIDLRDHYGLTQCVIEPDSKAFAEVDKVRSEWVVTLTGKVVARDAEAVNPDLPTGGIELRIEAISIESRAAELPLPVFGDLDYPEDTRLKYRFLDLRRERLHKNILLRSQVITSIRQRMVAQGFTEYQTPILTASSPEGARDFLVPSRIHPGKFYALPQAPQQFKQLLMVAGFDRYFQIAPCFRDEDARADRSPGEFYQLDVEMSFVTQDDVFAAIEPVLAGVFEEFADGRTVSKAPFVRIPYDESMLKYGVDKPDLRNPIEIVDVSDIFDRDDVAFKAFKSKTVRAIPAPGAAGNPRSFFDKINEWARAELGTPGLGYIVFEDVGGVLTGKGPIAKFLPTEAQAELAARAKVGPGDAVFFSADTKALRAAGVAGQARIRLGRELNLIDEKRFEFCWIVDFPMYEWDEDEKKIIFSHNPFS